MSIFKTISVGTGIALTIATVYGAQNAVADELNQNEDAKSVKTGARIATCFATSIVVGGIVNKIIHSVFD